MALSHTVALSRGPHPYVIEITRTKIPAGGICIAYLRKLAVRLVDQLNEETRAPQMEVDADVRARLAAGTAQAYRSFLLFQLGFVRPLERAFADAPGLDRFLDPRRLRKHLLLEADLQALGVRSVEIKRVLECMVIPLFDEPYEALGWAYIVERSTLAHPDLYRHLGLLIPGEIAFASSYLKCYFGAVGEMWQNFEDSLEAAARDRHQANQIIEAAKAGFRRHRHWRKQCPMASATVSVPVDLRCTRSAR